MVARFSVLSRRQHRFESGRGRQTNQYHAERSLQTTRYIRQIYGRDAPEHGWTGGDCQSSKQVPGSLDRPAVCVVDEVLELMSIPFAEADLHERNLKLRVFECMMKAGLQFTRDRERANARNEILERFGAAWRADKQDVS